MNEDRYVDNATTNTQQAGDNPYKKTEGNACSYSRAIPEDVTTEIHQSPRVRTIGVLFRVRFSLRDWW